MSTRNDGGQAFPSEFFETEHGDRVQAFAGSRGMTLRDYFAAQALAMTAAAYVNLPDSADILARRCYMVADAMLAERSKP